MAIFVSMRDVAEQGFVGITTLALLYYAFSLDALVDVVQQLVRLQGGCLAWIAGQGVLFLSFRLLPSSHYQRLQLQFQAQAIHQSRQIVTIQLGLTGSIIVMMQNSSRSSSRPLVFNTKADVHHFVMGNASQAYSVNLPVDAVRTAPVFHPASSLFDRYNRPSLLLRDCDQRDVITLHRNLVMAEQPLSKEVVEEVSLKASRSKREMPMAATGELFTYPPQNQFLRTAPLPTPAVPSREYQQNEIMFNYHEMASVKREKKLQLLEEIESRIAEAQREIAGLEQLQEEQRMEMGDLARVQQRVGEQLSKTYQAGKVQQQVGYATGFQIDTSKQQPPSIHQEMQPRQINEVLQEHIRANQDLLELAASLRRGTSSKQKDRPSPSRSMGSTLQRPKQQKSLVSTTKAGFRPPKAK